MRKNRLLTLISSLTLAVAGIAAVCAGGINEKKANAADASTITTNATKLILNDNVGWLFRTIEISGYSFSSGYTVNDFEYFIKDFYENDLSSSWSNQTTNRGYNWYSGGCNLSSGGSSGPYVFYFPTWLTDCNLHIKNNGNDYNMKKLNSVYKFSNNTVAGTNDGGVSKEITVNAENWGGSSSIGSSASTSFSAATITKNYVDTQNNVIQTASSESVCSYNKYAVPTIAPISGYTSPTEWKKESPSGSSYTTSELVKDGFDLYAVYTNQTTTYSVAFDANEGTGTMPSDSATAASNYTIPACDFYRNGYTFAGWATSSTGSVVYAPGGTIPADTYNAGDEVTLFAKWNSVGTKTIYFTCVDWGSDAHIYGWYADNTYPFGKFPGTKVTSAQYVYTNKDNQQVYLFVVPADLPNIMFAKDISNKTGTLTNAVDGTAYYYSWTDSQFHTWTINHDVTITYNSNYPSDSGLSPLTKTETAYRNEIHTLTNGTAFEAPTGYVFGGWYINAQGTGTKYLNGGTYTTGDDTSVGLYARWLEEIADGYYVKNFTTNTLTALEGTSPNYSGNVNVALDNEFKVVKYKDSEIINYWDYDNLSGTAKDQNQLVVGAENKNIKVAIPGTYTINMNSSTGTITVDAISVTHAYTVKNLTTNVPYVLSADDSLYKASGVVVNAGDVLAVYDSINESTPVLLTINAKSAANNNCYSNAGVTTVICTMSSCDVCVDLTNSTILCGGFDVDTYYMVVTHSDTTISYVKLSLNGSPKDPDNYREYLTSSSYSFLKGDVISYVDTTSGDSKSSLVAFDVPTVDPASLSSNFTTSSGKIACDANVSSFAYLKIGVGSKAGTNMVYFGNVDMEKAVAYAKNFNSKLGTVCNVTKITGWSKDIADTWSELATAFVAIDDASAKDILKKATVSSAYADLKAFASLYDFVYNKYNSSHSGDITDFASRFASDGGGVPASGSSYNLITLNNVSSSTWIIAVVAVVGVAAVGVFFIYRKRKEN